MSGQRVAAKRLTAVGYVRVSSRQQLDGYGLDVQEKAVRAYAKDHRLTLVELFREEGVSGTLPVTERPALMSALELITAGKADVLLVPNLDRLARELHVQEAALGLLWDAGKAVHTVEDGEVRQDDPDDPMRKAMRKMRGVLAELDKDTVVMRLRKGKQAKRTKGGFIGGQVPFGYATEGGHLVPEPTEQAVIQRMNELRCPARVCVPSLRPWRTRAIAQSPERVGIQHRYSAFWRVRKSRSPAVKEQNPSTGAGWVRRRRTPGA